MNTIVARLSPITLEIFLPYPSFLWVQFLTESAMGNTILRLIVSLNITRTTAPRMNPKILVY